MQRQLWLALATMVLGGCVGDAYAQGAPHESDYNSVCVSRDRANQPCETNMGPDEPPIIAGCPRHTCMMVGGGHAIPHEQRVTLNVASTRRTRSHDHMPDVCCYDVPRERQRPNG